MSMCALIDSVCFFFVFVFSCQFCYDFFSTGCFHINLVFRFSFANCAVAMFVCCFVQVVDLVLTYCTGNKHSFSSLLDFLSLDKWLCFVVYFMFRFFLFSVKLVSAFSCSFVVLLPIVDTVSFLFALLRFRLSLLLLLLMLLLLLLNGFIV